MEPLNRENGLCSNMGGVDVASRNDDCRDCLDAPPARENAGFWRSPTVIAGDRPPGPVSWEMDSSRVGGRGVVLCSVLDFGRESRFPSTSWPCETEARAAAYQAPGITTEGMSR